MVMGEEISRLMDGELEQTQLDVAYAQAKRTDGMANWVCYHVIGDALRGTGNVAPGFSRRFTARLAAEPTVLAPQAPASRPIARAWAAAAGMAAVTLVGWAAYSTWQPMPTTIAKASEAVTARPVQLAPHAIPADYIRVHEQYSPTAQVQGVGPYFSAATASGPAPRQ
jgi:sigma-E factor negative regulatory protein RseA